MSNSLIFLILFFTVIADIHSAEVRAKNTSQTRLIEFHIPQSDASQALFKIAEQADLQLLFPFRLARSVQANSIVGSYTIDDAMEILLQGTILKAERSPQGYFKIKKVSVLTNKQSCIEQRKSKDPEEDPVIEVVLVRGHRSQVDKRILRTRYSTAIVEDAMFEENGSQVNEDMVDVLIECRWNGCRLS